MTSSLVLPAKTFIIASLISIEIGFPDLWLSSGLAETDVECAFAAMTHMGDIEAEHVTPELRQRQP
jgi:hypothetical protein